MSRKRKLLYGLVAGLLIFVLWPLGEYESAYSTVLNDNQGNLLGARVAADGQWRFPPPDSVPHRIETCIRYYEDQYFYYHPGVNPFSIFRAIRQNIAAGKTVSGASTLTMQIARMRRGGRRNLWNKLLEALVAVKLELKYSKSSILKMYAGMAPFGGNVVGLDAASWRYYGRPPHILSWAESATLAVLPNNPGMIYPGTQDSTLLNKRNRLLAKLLADEQIDSTTYQLACLEPLPETPYAIPNKAPQLLTTFSLSQEGTRAGTTLDPFWQGAVEQLAERHHLEMKANGVENLAALVVDLETGKVLAYKGNTSDLGSDGNEVDVIQKPRSPGSTLKPILFASSLHKGLMLRRTLLPDIPSFFGGFAPKNFSRGYYGAVPANQSLSRSLNIGFCHLLRDYTYQQFHSDLNEWGMTTIDQEPGHYGLSLILGGCEVTPWELSQLYFSLYRKLAVKENVSIHYTGAPETRPSIDIDRDAIWQTFNTMTALARPEGERNWRSFSSSQLISWKTGTSFGFRDAWAIGMNGSVLVTVWVGNADGEGRAELTGIKSAAPLMLDIIKRSRYDPDWLKELKPAFVKTKVCRVSGMLAGENCPAWEEEVVSRYERSGKCTYHKLFQLDASGTYRVNSSCYSLAEGTEKVLFVLPPIQAHYYRLAVPDYVGLPEEWPGCQVESNPIAIIYPNVGSSVFIPTELDGRPGKVVLQATHQQTDGRLFWHIDNNYVGETLDEHQMAVWLRPGNHTLNVVDESGNSQSRSFTVKGE